MGLERGRGTYRMLRLEVLNEVVAMEEPAMALPRLDCFTQPVEGPRFR
jgi:hypothetical protein